MIPVLAELCQIGFFELPFHPENPLFWAFWISLLLGFGIQLLILHETRSHGVRWAFPAILLFGLIGCEGTCLVITGWDLLVIYLVDGLLLLLLTGAGLAGLFHRMLTGWKSKWN